ncbi:MAG: hypothetical protein ABJF10_28750 [Chthoniobacter sp.]|uniref:hypothetical protein n=1 Tax=Chthoniobacter sp. TaxID=2510640 RepID=UPI0032A4155C
MPENTARTAWETALAEHVAREYAANPIPTHHTLSPIETFQGQTIGHTVVAWWNRYRYPLLEEREVLRESFGIESDPAMILLSEGPGLVALNTIFKKPSPNTFFLTPESFDSFLEDHPDETHRWHVVFLCAFTPDLEPRVLSLAEAKYPLAEREQYWVHHETTALAPLFVRGCQHLWKLSGEEMILLEEAFYTWIS